MSSPERPDPAEMVKRLDAAAARLRAEDHRPQATPTVIEAEDRRRRPRVMPELDEELSAAQARMRAARRRLAEIEAELGWDMKISSAS